MMIAGAGHEPTHAGLRKAVKDAIDAFAGQGSAIRH